MAPVLAETGTEKQDESRNVSRPDGERGRDYYEFKEEIQYIRYKSRDLQSRLYLSVIIHIYITESLRGFFFCTIRAKTPEPGPASEDEMEIDDDTVRLDPCEFQFKNFKLKFVNV